MIYCYKTITTTGRQGTTITYSPPLAADPESNDQTAITTKTTDGATSQAPDDTTNTVNGVNINDPSTYLGEINGVHYRHFPDDFDMSKAPQDKAIEFKPVTLTEEERLALRQQRTASFFKEHTRKLINAKVGDELDLLADMGQLTEFAIIAVSTLWADRAGLVKLDDSMVKTYGERGAAVLNAVATGELTLRSSFETPAKMITTILPRYALIQDIVRDEYTEPLKKIGL